MKRLFVILLAVISLVSGAIASTPEIWFDAIAAPISLSSQDQQAMMKVLADCTLGDIKASHEPFPSAVSEDRGGRIVFVSLSDGKSKANVFRGEGLGLGSAIDCALTKIAGPSNGSKWTAIRLDIVESYRPLGDKAKLPSALFAPGLDGLATISDHAIALLPDELVAGRCIRETSKMRWDTLAEIVEPLGLKILDKSTNVFDLSAFAYTFTTQSFYTDGKTILPIYRGHMADMPVTQTMLMRAIRAGGDYLKQAVGSDGRFAYNYFPGDDEVGKDYNYVRHAGTIYSMCEVYQITRDPDLLASIRRAVGYMLRQKRPSGASAYILSDPSVTSLGVNALAALALAKYTEVTNDRQYVPLMIKLGRWMEQHLKKDGSFDHIIDTSTGKASSKTCDYYPGEAAFAFIRIARIDKQAHWLNSAEKAAKHKIKTQSKLEDAKLPNDQWLLYALNELYRVRPKPEYMKHTQRLAKGEMIGQVLSAGHPDEIGRLRGKLQSNITAVEGLDAACALMRDFGSKKEAIAIRQSLQKAVQYQMQIQFQPESVIYYPNPQRAVGGVPKGFANNIVRIDSVQHFLSGCIMYYRIIN
ncbi:MAG: hypothetical protein ABFD49_10680 [Armatimonadota bacterium]|nr:hypothetical protein [bacterium]